MAGAAGLKLGRVRSRRGCLGNARAAADQEFNLNELSCHG
jgi:hypothetical protein